MDRKEAIEIIQKNWPYSYGSQLSEAIQTLVPELQESEGERIRKELITYLESVLSHKEYRDKTIEGWIVWLKKQGTDISLFSDEQQKYMEKYISLDKVTLIKLLAERDRNVEETTESFEKQKSNDEVEPKFWVGDWVVSPNGVYWHIDDIRDSRYQVSSNLGNCADWPLNTNIYHEFTIQDAKDGDVLAVEDMIFIYERTLASHIVSYCKLFNKFFESFKDIRTCSEGNSNVHPATEEERELLFSKMKEAGYKWDAEKKELKKIEEKFIDKTVDCEKPQPAWNEEDEKLFNSARWHIKNSCSNGGKNSGEFEVYNWLKSIKERMKGE